MVTNELMERVQHEDTEWREARLHHAVHGSWSKDDCAVCIATEPDSPFMRHLTSMARSRLGVSDYKAIAARAESLGAIVGAFYGARRHEWHTSATTPARTVKLRASGPLAAILMGLLDDLETLNA